MRKRQLIKMAHKAGDYMLTTDNMIFEKYVNSVIVSNDVISGRIDTSLINWAQNMNKYLLSVQKSKGPYAHPSNYRYWKDKH